MRNFANVLNRFHNLFGIIGYWLRGGSLSLLFIYTYMRAQKSHLTIKQGGRNFLVYGS